MGRLLSRGSRPKFLIWPATWAPMSTTSSGSLVPVASVLARRSPRLTGTERNVEGLGDALCQYQKAPPPASAARTSRRISFFMVAAPGIEEAGEETGCP